MKCLLSIACVALYVVAIHGLTIPADIKAQWEEIKKDCINENPDVDVDHLEKLMKHEFVEGDDNLKKLVLCVNKKAHMQNEDGSYNVAAMKERLAKIAGNNDHDKDVDECTKEDHHDALENAWALAKCIKPKIAHLGD